MKQIDIEQVSLGIENQGFEYYMEHYARIDLEGTAVWPLVSKFREAQLELEEALSEAGVEIEK